LELRSVKGFFFFVLSRSFPFSFIWMQLRFSFPRKAQRTRGKPAWRNHPRGLRRSGLGPVAGAASHPPRGAGWSGTPGPCSENRHGPAAWSSPTPSLLGAAIFSSCFPSFVLPRLIVTAFGQEHCVRVKGLEQCAPDGTVHVLSSHEVSLYRKEIVKNTTFQHFILANVARNFPSLDISVQVPGLRHRG